MSLEFYGGQPRAWVIGINKAPYTLHIPREAQKEGVSGD